MKPGQYAVVEEIDGQGLFVIVKISSVHKNIVSFDGFPDVDDSWIFFTADTTRQCEQWVESVDVGQLIKDMDSLTDPIEK